MYENEQDSVLTVHSIQLKFGMDITDRCRTNPTDFGECRTWSFFFSFFIGAQESILIHYDLWSQILQSAPVSKWGIRMSSNLVCIL